MLYSTEEFYARRKELEELVDYPVKELIKESGLTRPTVQSWFNQEGKILVSTKITMWIAATNIVERRKKEFAELRNGLKSKWCGSTPSDSDEAVDQNPQSAING